MDPASEKPIRISRREFLKVTALGITAAAAGVVLPGCAPNPKGDKKLLDESAPRIRLGDKSVDEIEQEKALDTILGLEGKDAEKFVNTTKWLPFNQQSFEEALGNLKQNEIDFTEVPLLEKAEAEGAKARILLVPVAQTVSTSLSGFAQALVVTKAELTVNWVTLFHWVNHANQADINTIFKLREYAYFIQQIVSGALAGDGAILYRPASDKFQEAYFFFRQTDKGQWLTILSPNGAPITAMNTSMKHGVANAKEAARYFNKMLEVAKPIDVDEVPDKIKAAWKNTPPTLRFWSWAIMTKVREFAQANGVSLSRALEDIMALTKNPVLVVPVDLFLCDPTAPQFMRDDFCLREPPKS